MIFDGLMVSLNRGDTMTLYEIEQWHIKALELLRQLRIHEALEHLGAAAAERFQPALDEIEFTYRNILTYTGKGINDPMEDAIFNRLMASLHELTDSVKLHLTASSGSRIAAIKAELDRQALRENENLTENLMGLSFDNELQEMLRSASLFDDESESETAKNHRVAIGRAFLNLWLTDKFSENDIQVISRIFNSSSIPWFEKAMMVSALTLGSLRSFDARRFGVLMDLYGHPDPQISIRALFGIIISLFIYDKRLKYYPELKDRLQETAKDPAFADDVLTMVVQYFRSKETEKVARKLHNDILPQVIKLNQDLSERLDLDKLLQSGDFTDRNPDWEKYFDNQPGLVRKLEELTNMQMEGVDVFLSAFANLKAFPFFNELPNWFMPFYPENYAVQEALDDESQSFKDAFLKGLDLSVYMCNSDKFSFVLNLRHMPQQQKALMVQMFEGEAEQLAELKNEELSEPSLIRKRITIQYIQDLYRFFKIHPLRNEIPDVFARRVSLTDLSAFTEVFSNPEFYRTVANFHLDNGHFEEAGRLYEYLIASGENYAELYEKAGYCKQETARYEEAVKLYQRADLFDSNHNWLLRKMAQCHVATGNTDQAVACYKELLNMEPENLKITASLATCLLNDNDTEKALEYFYKIEFNSPGSVSAMRPVAWCLFLLNRNTEAESYYSMILDMEPNSYDFLNAGHVAFSLGNKEKAIKHYQQSIDERGDDIRSFVKSYNKDRKHLLANDVDPVDIALMLDYLRFGRP